MAAPPSPPPPPPPAPLSLLPTPLPTPSLPPPPPVRVDISTHGFIPQTFGSSATPSYWASILKTSVDALRPVYHNDSCPHWSLPPPVGQPGTVLARDGPSLDYLPSFNTRGPVVPQTLWRPIYPRTRELHVDHSPLCLPIFFIQQDAEGVGIPVLEALRKKTHTLRDSYSPVELGGKTTTQLRIRWSGYPESHRQLQIRDETQDRNPIALGRLATHVAKSMQRFFDAPGVPDSKADPRWRVGAGGIQLQDVILIGVVHTSAGTWQPILQLSRSLP
ncbi:hypothetical protein BV25DRAFT_1829544 [Artomyces pyxidatus]|uniref:Uncharacterized protein n=1 Tax=Artomyces pyxidatus TaxID=48021 RepID=A0ACB8SSY8_9AGAM|nr:hypothetical protein BV25DRAFT_1829544 [Artomyces pyxidatus]